MICCLTFFAFYISVVIAFIPITIFTWLGNVFVIFFNIDPQLILDPSYELCANYEPLTIKYEVSKGKNVFQAMWHVIGRLDWFPILRTGLL